MPEILIIEPNRFQAEAVSEHIRAHLEISSTISDSLASAQEAISGKNKPFLAVILNLAVSPEDYAPFPDIPTIAVTNGVPTSGKKIAFAANVLDYIPDCLGYHLEYILQLLKRVLFAQKARILIAAREKASRTLMRRLLADKGYGVAEAGNAAEVLACLRKHPDTCMLLIDGDMCEGKDFALIKTIRSDFKKNELSILTLCERSKEHQRIMLLRCGANDCIDKPLRIEEFQVRVMLNLQLMEVLCELTEISNRDFLTRLYNRTTFNGNASGMCDGI